VCAAFNSSHSFDATANQKGEELILINNGNTNSKQQVRIYNPSYFSARSSSLILEVIIAAARMQMDFNGHSREREKIVYLYM
jgi:hypothetical protein